VPSIVYQLSSVHVRSDVRVFHKQCVSLAKAGYKVHLLVADGKGDEVKQGVVVHDMGKPQGRLNRMLFVPVKLFWKACSSKAIICQFHDPELLPVGLLIQLCSKVKVIYDAHESYPDDILYKDYLSPWLSRLASFGIRHLENFAARRLAAVITVTDYHAQRFRRLNKATYTICNYPLLSEWSSFLATNTPRQQQSLCYVGNITRKRGLGMLLQSIQHLDVTVHLAGGYEPEDYRDELVAMPAWDKVVEHGYLARQEAISLMASCQVGLMLFMPEPNHINSLSTKVFEYMAAGCAVLVSDFPVYRQLIFDSGCGLCVNPENPFEIAQAIQNLLSDPEGLEVMGKRGKQLIREKYNWETQEETLLRLYEILQRK